MTIHGFELVDEQNITELNTNAQFYRHLKTGAELLSLQNDDENKVFGVTFRTPPTDSTGLPHIMEHAVLGGSKKYPLKEPFVELIKGSLKTFVNAMTFPDKTMYPVASQNLQDFYNLIDVYLDAVFYPLITPYHLQQEGWHYELKNKQEPLIYKGVVFNEMKGAYSSPDALLYRYSQHSLFPDTTYGLDSGGDPKVMPDLTYEQFKQFHERYYHPSNSYLFFYGDDDPEERLRLLNDVLQNFDQVDVDSSIALQPKMESPKTYRYPYSVDSNGDESTTTETAESQNKEMIRINWLLPEGDDPTENMLLGILSYAMISTHASPLRKILLDSGLGEDVFGGVSGQTRQMTFSVGMKGLTAENVKKAETLILDSIGMLAEGGFEDEMVEAALNTIEFSLREYNTGSYPRGISILRSAMSAWLHDRDPLTPLAFDAPLSAAKERLKTEPDYLQNLIQRHLVQNTHRTTVILHPDTELQKREEAEEKERLAEARAQMTDEALQAVVDNTETLKLRQEKPDSPEALAAIPHLALADLDKENKQIPIDVSETNGSKILYHDLFTNGIVYLSVGFDLHTVPTDLLPYVKLFGRSLVEMGTEQEDYVKLTQRIGRKTGGISPSSFVSNVQEQTESSAWFFLHGKSTMSQTADLLDIMRDMLLTVELDNPERFRQIVLKIKTRTESSLIPSGHNVVNGRLRAQFTEANWVGEQMGGISYLFFLRQLVDQIENDWPAVLEKLTRVKQILLNRNTMLCNVTLDAANWSQFEPQLANFITAFPTQPTQHAIWSPPYHAPTGPTYEGLTMPAQVNYVGKGANLYDLGYQLHGSVSVITNHLRTSWLWEKVRAQGGAYGCFCPFRRRSGVFSFLSYRDPNLLDTLDVYDRTSGYLRKLDLSQSELTNSIIGTIGSMDSYQLPDAKGDTSMTRYLLGESDEFRQQIRDEVLSTTVADFKAFAEILEAVNREGSVVVMGSQEAIEGVNSQKGDWLQVTKVM